MKDRDSCVPRNSRMAVFDHVETRTSGIRNSSPSICRTSPKVYRIEHLGASTIDAPEVYEQWGRILPNTSIAFLRFCGKRCGKACAKLERARQMRVSQRFAQPVGRIVLTDGFTGLIRNQTHL